MGISAYFRSRNWLLRFMTDTRGQDMLEYALMAAMVAIACGAILPPMTPSISNVYSKLVDLFTHSPS